MNLEQRTEAADVIHRKLSDKGRVLIIDSLKPEVWAWLFQYVNRAYAVLWHYPWHKWQQLYHSARSFVKPWEYNAKDYGYHSPSEHDILWKEQTVLFNLTHKITPFFGRAISDILIFEKR